MHQTLCKALGGGIKNENNFPALKEFMDEKNKMGYANATNKKNINWEWKLSHELAKLFFIKIMSFNPCKIPTMDQMFVPPPKIICGNPSTQCDDIWRWEVIRVRLDHENEAHMMGLMPL